MSRKALLTGSRDAVDAINWPELIELQKVTLAARKRTGNNAIGSNVEAGCFNLVNVTYPDGINSTVEIVRSGLTRAELLEALNAL